MSQTSPLQQLSWHRFAEEKPPKGEMFIWARWSPERGQWSLGLGYWTVSGKWADAYGAIPAAATHWKPIGNPPEST